MNKEKTYQLKMPNSLYKKRMVIFERQLLLDALRNTKSFAAAARLLGIPRPTFLYRCKVTGIKEEVISPEKEVDNRYE